MLLTDLLRECWLLFMLALDELAGFVVISWRRSSTPVFTMLKSIDLFCILIIELVELMTDARWEEPVGWKYGRSASPPDSDCLRLLSKTRLRRELDIMCTSLLICCLVLSRIAGVKRVGSFSGVVILSCDFEPESFCARLVKTLPDLVVIGVLRSAWAYAEFLD